MRDEGLTKTNIVLDRSDYERFRELMNRRGQTLSGWIRAQIRRELEGMYGQEVCK
jgi:hypothetical protein